MSTLNAQKIAIVLEIFSFFFVTLDLYGEERLNALDKSVKALVDRIRQIPVGDKVYNTGSRPFLQVGQVMTQGANFSDGCSGHVQFFIFVLYLIYIDSLFQVDTGSEIVDWFILIMLGTAAIPLVLLVVLIIIIALALLIQLPFSILINFSRFLLFRLNLNGSLVLIGTLTFIASKLISLSNL